MFKVVPDQLKISEGWVRCGHCAEVFDAGAHLQDAPTDSRWEEPAPTAPQPLVAMAPPPEPAMAPPPPTPTPTNPPYPPFVPQRMNARARGEAALEAAAANQPRLGALPAVPPAPVAVLPPPPPVVSMPMPLPPPAEPEALAPPDVSFVRRAQRQAFWRRRSVVAVLALLLVLGLAGLAAQVAVQERDRLAAAEPRLKPVLMMLCQPLACSLGPPRRIEAIAIDSSTFNRLREGAYRLSVTLKNQAPTEVAMPALELTLTDTQDQPVLRRVVTPAELAEPAPQVIAAGGEWSGQLAFSVAATAQTGRIAGYRLLAFYP